MRFGYLRITNKSGETERVEFAFADDGKVFIDKDGNEVSYIERERIDEFAEVDFVDDSVDDSEALSIILGGAE